MKLFLSMFISHKSCFRPSAVFLPLCVLEFCICHPKHVAFYPEFDRCAATAPLWGHQEGDTIFTLPITPFKDEVTTLHVCLYLLWT